MDNSDLVCIGYAIGKTVINRCDKTTMSWRHSIGAVGYQLLIDVFITPHFRLYLRCGATTRRRDSLNWVAYYSVSYNTSNKVPYGIGKVFRSLKKKTFRFPFYE